MRTSDLLGLLASKLEQFFECVHNVGFFKKAKTLHHFVHQYIQKQKHSLTILCIHFALSSCYCFLRVILCQYFLYLVFSGSIRMTIKAKGVRYQIPRERERNIAWELRSSWGLNRVATRQISFIFFFWVTWQILHFFPKTLCNVYSWIGSYCPTLLFTRYFYARGVKFFILIGFYQNFLAGRHPLPHSYFPNKTLGPFWYVKVSEEVAGWGNSKFYCFSYSPFFCHNLHIIASIEIQIALCRQRKQEKNSRSGYSHENIFHLLSILTRFAKNCKRNMNFLTNFKVTEHDCLLYM